MAAPRRHSTAPLPLLVAGLAALAISRPADAGEVWTGAVAVATYNGGQTGYFRGSLASVRRSANVLERIGCRVSYGLDWNYGDCEAVTAAGTSRWCYTDDPALLQAISVMGPASQVHIEWEDFFRCSYISVANDSAAL